MKNLTILLLFLCFTAFGQIPTTSELTAQGNAKAKVKPDIVVMTIDVNKEDQSEKTALKQLNEEVDKLQKFFTKLGFAASSIKIADYSVTSDRYTEGEKKFRAASTLKIEFKLDTKVLDIFYQELQAGNYKDVLVDYETGLSPELEKATLKSLVQKAIEDAKDNADNIAKSLGVKIVRVKSVSKFGNDAMPLSIVEETKFKPLAVAAYAPAPPTAFSKYDVAEKELEEDIIIVFEIEKL
jgi:uncharacterized protein YggE